MSQHGYCPRLNYGYYGMGGFPITNDSSNPNRIPLGGRPHFSVSGAPYGTPPYRGPLYQHQSVASMVRGPAATSSEFRPSSVNSDSYRTQSVQPKGSPPLESEELPIMAHREHILAQIRSNPVTCIEGETGCGKSTRVPQFIWKEFLDAKKSAFDGKDRSSPQRTHDQNAAATTRQDISLESGAMPNDKIDQTSNNGSNGLSQKCSILITQPRRIACTSLAKRVAAELDSTVGNLVGYRISGDNLTSGQTRLTFVTTGYLLQVLVNNPEWLFKFTHLILDEVHERSIDADLLSLVIRLQTNPQSVLLRSGNPTRNMIWSRPDFRLIIMSATLQGDLFAKYFTPLGYTLPRSIFVGAKRFPVQTLYLNDLIYYSAPSRRVPPPSASVTPDGALIPGEDFAGSLLSANGLPILRMSGESHEVINQMSARFDSCASVTLVKKKSAITHASAPQLHNLVNPQNGNTEGQGDIESGEEDSVNGGTLAEDEIAPFDQSTESRLPPNVAPAMNLLVMDLIKSFALQGESVLVFLPGIGEITDLYDSLSSLERSEYNLQDSREYRLFVLHSTIPRDEQEEVFSPPNSGTVHIILASNIAESSLTLPNVRIVIDFGLRRTLIYDPRKHVSSLVRTWSSKASSDQRKGRCGRTFHGLCIRLFTRSFANVCMAGFDPPEMETAPLEKLYLTAKQISTKLSVPSTVPTTPNSPPARVHLSPMDILYLSIQPPNVPALNRAIETLHEVGALSDTSENASISAIGHLMMHLPIDLHLCRLLIFGILFGSTVDAIVLAACLSSTSVFTMPTQFVAKNPAEYSETLQRSSKTRVVFDMGHYSEPLMMRNVFVHWLLEFGMRLDFLRGTRRDVNVKVEMLRSSRQFAEKHSVVPKRLVHIATTTADICVKMNHCLVPDANNQAQGKISQLLRYLPNQGRRSDASRMESSNVEALKGLFTSDIMRLKLLLVGAFTPQFLVGSPGLLFNGDVDIPSAQITSVRKTVQSSIVSKKKPKETPLSKREKILETMLSMNLDPRRTAVVNGLPREWKHDKDAFRRSLALMCYGLDFDIHYTTPATGGPAALVYFPPTPANEALECHQPPSPGSDVIEQRSWPPRSIFLEPGGERSELPRNLSGPNMRYSDSYNNLRMEGSQRGSHASNGSSASSIAATDEHRGYLGGKTPPSSGLTLCGRYRGLEQHRKHRRQLIEEETPVRPMLPSAARISDLEFCDIPQALHLFLRYGHGRWKFPAPVADIQNCSMDGGRFDPIFRDRAICGLSHPRRLPHDLSMPNLNLLSRLTGAESNNTMDLRSGFSSKASTSHTIPSDANMDLLEDSAPNLLNSSPSGNLGVPSSASQASLNTYSSPAEESRGNLRINAYYSGDITIMKPVSLFGTTWTLLGDAGGMSSKGNTDGKASANKRIKGVCGVRSPPGCLAVCPLIREGLGPSNFMQPKELFGVFVTSQGTDAPNMCWIEGFTLLPLRLAGICLLAFTRRTNNFNYRVVYTACVAPRIVQVKLNSVKKEFSFEGDDCLEGNPLLPPSKIAEGESALTGNISLTISDLYKCQRLRQKLSDALDSAVISSAEFFKGNENAPARGSLPGDGYGKKEHFVSVDEDAEIVEVINSLIRINERDVALPEGLQDVSHESMNGLGAKLLQASEEAWASMKPNQQNSFKQQLGQRRPGGKGLTQIAGDWMPGFAHENTGCTTFFEPLSIDDLSRQVTEFRLMVLNGVLQEEQEKARIQAQKDEKNRQSVLHRGGTRNKGATKATRKQARRDKGQQRPYVPFNMDQYQNPMPGGHHPFASRVLHQFAIQPPQLWANQGYRHYMNPQTATESTVVPIDPDAAGRSHVALQADLIRRRFADKQHVPPVPPRLRGMAHPPQLQHPPQPPHPVLSSPAQSESLYYTPYGPINPGLPSGMPVGSIYRPHPTNSGDMHDEGPNDPAVAAFGLQF